MAGNYDRYETIHLDNGKSETRYYNEGGELVETRFYGDNGKLVRTEREVIRFGKHQTICGIPYATPADEWPDIIE